MVTNPDQHRGAVDLYWIPLGAGAHVVRVSGKIFEAISAFLQRRRRCHLYHSALEVRVPEGRFVIEQAPIPDLHGANRGVVAEGPVGTRWLGRFRLFRYEIRRWRQGQIPDIRNAVASPVRLSEDLTLARRILDVLPSLPIPVWGRNELDAGDMWNSNSVISWVLAASGADVTSLQPPRGGRAPGWGAGLVVAAREREQRHASRATISSTRAWKTRQRRALEVEQAPRDWRRQLRRGDLTSRPVRAITVPVAAANDGHSGCS
jgi:hypothetical protein